MNSPACCKLHMQFRFRTSSNYLLIQQEFKTLSIALEYKHLRGSQTPIKHMPKSIKLFCTSPNPLGRLMSLKYDWIRFINFSGQPVAIQLQD